ncbi:hypothetical protein ACFY2R_20365, partial [Micromonospora olivasterospora]
MAVSAADWFALGAPVSGQEGERCALAAAVATLELNESASQALERFTGMRVSRAELPLLRDDIGTLGTLAL